MTTFPSFCRCCHNECPISVEVEDGRVVEVSGDRDNPRVHGLHMCQGSCVAGRTQSDRSVAVFAAQDAGRSV
jgi:hypothetical protein